MDKQKAISILALSAFLTASLFLLFCPQMTMAKAMKGPCAGINQMPDKSGTQLSAAPAGCVRAHVAVFRSLIFVVPNLTQILALVIMAMAVAALAALWREKLRLWRVKSFVKLKAYGQIDKLKNNLENFRRWLTLLEKRDFASC